MQTHEVSTHQRKQAICEFVNSNNVPRCVCGNASSCLMFLLLLCLPPHTLRLKLFAFLNKMQENEPQERPR